MFWAAGFKQGLKCRCCQRLHPGADVLEGGERWYRNKQYEGKEDSTTHGTGPPQAVDALKKVATEPIITKPI